MRDISFLTTVSASGRPAGKGPAGTYTFIAPERWKGTLNWIGTKEELGMKADVYSFGVILWIISELKEPFEGADYY
eukprot:m.312912 g.312912  ORF g.312912 m.312912 type:complete len:76 (+) comp327367_c0_seq1:643-870(+)